MSSSSSRKPPMVMGPISTCAKVLYLFYILLKLLLIYEFSVCPFKSSMFLSTQSSLGNVYSKPLMTNVRSPNYLVSLHFIGFVFKGILPSTYFTAQLGIVISDVPESTVIRQSGFSKLLHKFMGTPLTLISSSAIPNISLCSMGCHTISPVYLLLS